jgi:hypothetical protein
MLKTPVHRSEVRAWRQKYTRPVQSVFSLHYVYIAAFTFHEISCYRKTTFLCFKADAPLVCEISGLEVTCCGVYASACGIHIKFAVYNTFGGGGRPG